MDGIYLCFWMNVKLSKGAQKAPHIMAGLVSCLSRATGLHKYARHNHRMSLEKWIV
jgi:hypothetical protein